MNRMFYGGVYLKKSGLILQAIGSADGIPPHPPFCPHRLEGEAERTISSFSRALHARKIINDSPPWRQILFFTL
jgi:hypothetical protein